MVENAHLLGAGIAVWLAGLGVCIGEGTLAKKSLTVLWKNPELSGKLLVFTILGIALTESAAIYGLIVSFSIVNNPDLARMQALGAWLAIGLAGCGAGIGEGRAAGKALEAFHRNPANQGKVLTFMILFIALVESAAIYGLITAFNILGA